jgi:hypothetical protein
MAVATALTIAAVGAAAASTVMSFADANRQKKLQRQAEAEAKDAMAEARKRSGVNYYDPLAIQKEPYELQREALLSAGAQAIQAGVEGESRGIGATAGRIMMAQNEAQAGQRTAMGADLNRLAELSAAEDSRLRDINLQLDLEEVAGAQLAARDAQEARAAAIAQGMQGIQNVAQMGIQAMELYPGGKKNVVPGVDENTKTDSLNQKIETGMGKVVSPSSAIGSAGQVPLPAQSDVERMAKLFKEGLITQKEYRDFINNVKTNPEGTLIPPGDYNPNPFQPF